MGAPGGNSGFSFVTPPDDELDTGGAPGRGLPATARWWPAGGGAAITGLLMVLVAWLGASPLVQAVASVVPQGVHRIGPLSEESIQFGNGEFYGVTPGLLPVISFGVRGGLTVLALVLALRARHAERSALATAAWASAALSTLLFAAAGVLSTIGLAMGHGAGFYGVPV